MKNRIKEVRLQYNVTQATLANYLGIAQNTLSYWENGKFDIDSESLCKIANYFNTSIDYLLGNDNKKIKATQNESPLSPEQQNLFDSTSDLTDEELRQAIDYVEFLKSKRSD